MVAGRRNASKRVTVADQVATLQYCSYIVGTARTDLV